MGFKPILVLVGPSANPDHALHGGEGLESVLALVPLGMDVHFPAQHTLGEGGAPFFAIRRME